MKPVLLFFSVYMMAVFTYGQQTKTFDIFSYKEPAGFELKENSKYLFYSKNEGKNYCQLFVYPAAVGEKDVEKDFKKNWDVFARNPLQKVGNPETTEYDTLSNNWYSLLGASKGVFNRQPFVITVSTFTKNDITYCVTSVFTDKKFIPIAQEFAAGVVPDEKKFAGTTIQQSTPNSNNNTITNSNHNITLSTTNFDDGWVANAQADFVKLTKAGTEVRLHYIDKALDDARPNTIDAPEYYWSKYITPYFNTSNVQKWSGVQYPVIYHMQANAVDKATGKQFYVAIKIVYSGGARPIVVITPNQNSYNQQFPHPNDMDRMLNYNKFAVSINDVVGKWNGSGGGGVEYYNVYSGTYAGMSAVSSTDEFVFNKDGTYNSTYRSASMNNSGAQFGGQDFKGTFSVTDWSITATNRYKGKTKQYNAQLIAVKGGYLLYMSDTDNSSMNYTLFKTK
ncbi:MAG: hypothetical protein K2X48_12590 [Chitinophagaceae bacterium]|nr:hypothetical protein [Chitinophagaceae bacterium]